MIIVFSVGRPHPRKEEEGRDAERHPEHEKGCCPQIDPSCTKINIKKPNFLVCHGMGFL